MRIRTLLLALLLLLSSVAAEAKMLLTGTSDLVQVITASGVSTIYVHASWADMTTTALTPGRTNTQITTATTTTVIGSPAASTQRQVKILTIRNSHASSSNAITIQHTDGTTIAEVLKYTLLAGETIQYTDDDGFRVIDASGQVKSLIAATSLPLPTGASTWALEGGGWPAALGAGGGLKVDGSGTALPVSGTVTVTDGAGALNVICDSGCAGGTQYAVDTALGATPTGTLAVGIRDDALSTLTPVEGDAIGLRVNARGALWVDLETRLDSTNDSITAVGAAASGAAKSGNPVQTRGVYNSTQPTVTTGQAVENQATARGALIVAPGVDNFATQATLAAETTKVIGTVNVAAGQTIATTNAGTFATQATLAAETTKVIGTVNISSGQTVTVTDGAGALNVICDSGCSGGTQYTEDAAAAADPIGNALIVVRNDARSGSLTTTDGDNVAIRGTNSGEMYVKHVDSIPVTGTFWQGTQPVSIASVPSHDVTNAGTFAVQATLAAETTKVIGTVNVAAGQTIAATNAGTFATQAAQSGTWTVQPGNTANTTAWLVTGTGGTFPVTGTFWQATQPVSIATAPVLVAGSAIIGKVGIDQTTPGTTNRVDVGTFPDNEPFNIAQVGGSAVVADPCMREARIPISISQTGNTQLATGTASERIFICSFHIITATAQNIALVSGTGTVCATSPSGVLGFGGATAATGWNFAANGGIQMGHSNWSYGKTDTDADNICLFQSGAGQLSGGLTYVSAADF